MRSATEAKSMRFPRRGYQARRLTGTRVSGTRVFVPGSEPSFDMPPGRPRIFLQKDIRRLARLARERLVLLQVGIAQQRRAALALAKILAGAAQLQVLARDLEAVAVFENDLEPRTRSIRERRGVQQDAGALARIFT